MAAVATLAAWVAIGSLFRIELRDRLVTAAVRLAIGAAITSFLWALFAVAGQVSLALWVVPGLEAAFLAARWKAVAQAGRELARALQELCAERWVRWTAAAALVVYWVNAIAPPRDADVVRYHLEHIRQILADGAWLPIPDYHFALPFGWSLNYLPFERFGLPEGAHMLNLGLWILALAMLCRIMSASGGRRLALALCAVAGAQALLLKSATTAHADAYVIFVVTILTALLAGPELSPATAAALGFTAWAAAGSRYQALALGLATTAVVLVWAGRNSGTRRVLFRYAGGTGLALGLAAPFYLFNWRHFGNPFWPLLVDLFNRPPAYADQVAAAFNRSLTGAWQPSTVLAGLREAFASAFALYTFPVPHLVLAFLLLSLRWRTAATARLARFLAAFLLLWAIAQPAMYSRFYIYLLPAAWAGLAGAMALVRSDRAQWWATRAASLVALGLAAFAIFYSRDAFALAATGDLARYHATTWFYDVYDWVNDNTPPDARFLVVVTGGTSYYLDRPLRRADPSTSGVVDWSAVRGADDLVRVMREGGYDYLLYEWRNWRFPGGEQMIAAVREVLDEGQLVEVRRFDAVLAGSRVLRQSHVTPVLLFALPEVIAGATGGDG